MAGRHASGGALLRRQAGAGRLGDAARPGGGRPAGADGCSLGGARSAHGADGLRGGHAVAEKKSGGSGRFMLVWGGNIGI